MCVSGGADYGTGNEIYVTVAQKHRQNFVGNILHFVLAKSADIIYNVIKKKTDKNRLFGILLMRTKHKGFML